MDQTSKDTINFCMEFVRNNVYEQSQNVQCRTWIKIATDLIEKNALDSGDFIISSLKSMDDYFTGIDTSATTNTVIDKVKLVETLMKNV